MLAGKFLIKKHSGYVCVMFTPLTGTDLECSLTTEPCDISQSQLPVVVHMIN